MTLKLKLKKIDPVKYALITSLLYLTFIVLVVLPFVLLMSLVGMSEDFLKGLTILGGGFISIIVVLIFYGLFIFIFTFIIALIFNFILKKLGGLPMDFDNAELEISEIGKDSLIEKN